MVKGKNNNPIEMALLYQRRGPIWDRARKVWTPFKGSRLSSLARIERGEIPVSHPILEVTPVERLTAC
jgi:hypothetical protein